MESLRKFFTALLLIRIDDQDGVIAGHLKIYPSEKDKNNCHQHHPSQLAEMKDLVPPQFQNGSQQRQATPEKNNNLGQGAPAKGRDNKQSIEPGHNKPKK